MMNRSLVYVVGLGPGSAQYLTAQAQTALQAADVLCGYTVYIDLVRPLYPDKEVYATGMTREIDRCRWALETAKGGKTVALVCSGDAGVYGMASAVGAGGALPGGGGRDRARPDRRFERGRGAGCAVGTRFLRDFAVGPADAAGRH